jgi:hypothetical protein
MLPGMNGSLAYWINRSWLVRYAVIVVALVAGGVIAVTVFRPHRSPVTLSMRPVPPLTTAACVTEVRHYGYGAGPAGDLCRPAAGQRWYHARLTNRGPQDFMSCTARGFSSSGQVVFSGRLPFEFGGIRGLFAPGHRAITFSWYLPRKTASPVARYTATCSARPYPWD